MNLPTYGDAGPLFSVGEPCTVDPCWGLLDIRGGDILDGMLFGGAKAGRFRGLGLRVGCGDDKGAGADATAVDMVDTVISLWISRKWLIDFLHRMQGHPECGQDRKDRNVGSAG